MTSTVEISANELKAWEAISLNEDGALPPETDDNHGLRARTHRRPTSVNTSLLSPTNKGLNYCGQAAAASVISAWNKGGGKSAVQILDDVLSRFPPDLNVGEFNFGTSPNRIMQILNTYGLKASFFNIPVWQSGGFMNPLNQPGWHAYRSQIEGFMHSGYTPIVLVDTGMLPNRTNDIWWSLHYTVLQSTGGGQTTLCNSFGSDGRYSDEPMPENRFHEAWEARAWPIPWLKFATIIAYE
ncbi:hypothetical protein [Shimia sp.]|uniref:hypothetical protein n=1 Tax=unclassified Shimia TaxID=2630038 RepID=UPI0025CC3CD4|nr:hypothetical protein [Shimia sp.]MCH2066972.1 hypothetical protein [Shimia sp.]